jgi:competence protein ComGC
MTGTIRGRLGFTLFGLLAILAVIGLLLALLLPAIQKIREAANRMQCANNLRQIGIAAHNYHNDYNKLPPGYLGPTAENGALDDKHQNIGSLAVLLPYMEQDNLFKNIQTDFAVRNTTEAWWKDKRAGFNNLSVAQTALKLFRCPSDIPKENLTEGVVAAFHNLGTTMDSRILPAPNDQSLAWTNYTGVAGCLGKVPEKDKNAAFFNLFEGTMMNRSELTLGQLTVQDGTSNTLMFGEGLGGMPKGARDRAWSWMGVGAMVTYYGLTPTPPADNTAHYRFGSRHARSVQFCFGDCSIRGVRPGKTAEIPAKFDANQVSDWLILQQLSGRKDGLVHDTSAIMD